MRWKIRVWMSAAFLVATSALKENDPTGEAKLVYSTTPDSVQTISGSNDFSLSTKKDGDESAHAATEQPPQTKLNKLLKFLKAAERDNHKVVHRIREASGVRNAETTSHLAIGGTRESVAHSVNGGVEDDREGESIARVEGEDSEDGANDGGESEDSGTREVGGNVSVDGEDNEDNSNVGVVGGDNDGNEDDDSSEGEGENNGDNENGGNEDNEGGGSNDESGENAQSTPADTGADNEEDIIVETTTGPVRGYAWGENTNIISYIDVSYGTFNSPFEAPVSPTSSESIHEVKEHSKRCPQLQGDLYVGDSDCLTLSIFKPIDASDASVLVHIYDGNFSSGSANPAIYGPEYLVSRGIILVLPNYRLGPLGFLCLQNETAQGNAALKDLTLALSWVKENILNFGGDPENIAVSGDGTAGALAGYLALSPMSKGYVSKVITDSGSVLSHWALDRNPLVAATYLLNNINDFSTWQNLEPSVLVTAAKEVTFRPCLENNSDQGTHFLVKTPWTIIEEEEITIKFMLGSAEYAGMHEFLKHTEGSIQLLNDDVGLLLPNDLRFETDEERIIAGKKVKAQYFGDADISLTHVERLSLYFTDAGYLGPGIRTARLLANVGATVYFYEFSFVGDLNRELEAINHPIEGAVRGDIIGYLFTQDGSVLSDDTKEKRMVDHLIELWTSFLKTGTPTAENIEWNRLQSVSATEEEWLSIGPVPSLQKGLHVNRLSLWTDIYDQHFIEKNLAFGTSPSVYTMIILQVTFFMIFFRNASHFF